MSWMQTYKRIAFEPLNPRPEQFDIEDIAHALSMICRFGGHSRQFYSVAEHSYHVSRICPPEVALAGLLHDAAEAYVGDLIRPIKHEPELARYREVEDELLRLIFINEGLPPFIPTDVKYADNRMLALERDDPSVCGGACSPWGPLPPKPPDIGLLSCWGPKHAEYVFLERYRELQALRR